MLFASKPFQCFFVALILEAEVQAPREIAEIPMAWQVERRADPAAGERQCRVTSRGGHVTASLSRRRGEAPPAWRVRVGFGNQPGSLRYIRINRQYYTTAGTHFRGAEAQEIVAGLKAPGVFVVEWAKAPDQVKQVGLFGTGDFAAKAAACEDWVTGSPT